MSTDHKAARMRGLRDVSTVQTKIARSTPSSRTQAVSRFARLENERSRILRELDAWNARKGEAERMLAKVEAELSAMRTLLLDVPPSARGAQSASRGPREHREVAAEPVATHSHALIEY